MDGWMEGSGEQRREDGRIKKGELEIRIYGSKVKVFVLGDTPRVVRRLNDKHQDHCNDNGIVSHVRQGGSCPP